MSADSSTIRSTTRAMFEGFLALLPGLRIGALVFVALVFRGGAASALVSREVAP